MVDRSITYEFRGRFDTLRTGLASSGRAVREFGGDLTALDAKGERMRRGLDQLGGNAGRMGLALGGAFAVVATKAANFEQSMSFVQAATHETAQNMDALRQAALDAGQQTAFSATEAAGAIEELAKAGVSTQSILNGGLNGALDLAAAGGLDVAKAAEAAASAMTQFRLEGSDVPHIADLLAAGAGKAQGSVEDMSMALNQSGLVAAQTGLSIEETTGALSAFASAGLVGSDSGTAFKTMLQALTPSSKEAAKLMDELGISAYDSQGNFVGLAKFAGSLKEGLSDLSVEQQNAALKTIFGSDAVRAASVLYEQGAEGIQSWIDKTNDAGYASETAAIRMDNLKGDLEQLGGALETLFIGAGDGQTGFLRELTQGVTDFVNALNNLPGPIKSALGSLVGLAALGAGGFWFTAKAVSTIANTRQALADLGIEAGGTRSRLASLNALKFTAALAALAALGEGIENAFDANINETDLQRNLEALANDKVSGDLKQIADDLNTVGSTVNNVAEPVQEAVHVFGLLGDTPIDRATDNIEAVDQALASMVESGNIDGARTAFANLLEVIRQNGGSQVDAIERFDAFATALDNATAAEGEHADATTKVGDAHETASRQIELTDEQLKSLQEKASQTAGQFLNLGESLNDSKVSLHDWISELNRQAKALERFAENAQTAARKGLDEGLIKSLQEAGPEGALRLSQLAKASDREIGRANRAFRRGQSATDAYTQAVVDLASGILGLPSGKDIRINMKGDRDAIAAIERIKSMVASIPTSRRITVFTNYLGAYNRNLGGGRDGDPSTPYDVGGYTGAGGKYEPAGIVHRDEVVIPKELVHRDRALLKSRYGFLPGMDQLHTGGLAGYASGGKVGALEFAGLPALNLATMNLGALNKALAASSKALEREKDQRNQVVDKMTSLRSSVSGKLTSDLFGATDPWTAGGGVADALAILRGDTKGAKALNSQIKALQAKGLKGGALDDLLANADPATIANFALAPTADIKRFMAAYNSRNAAVAAVGRGASDAAYGAELKTQTKEMREVANRVSRVEVAIRQEHRHDRKSKKRGAGSGSRSIRRG